MKIIPIPFSPRKEINLAKYKELRKTVRYYPRYINGISIVIINYMIKTSTQKYTPNISLFMGSTPDLAAFSRACANVDDELRNNAMK